jgi:DNA-binding GntR family transcriptional regulator
MLEAQDDEQIDSVLSRLRQDIVNGSLRPNSMLKARDLAVRYGVSTIPVREALQRLQGEGLVTMARNRGARVRVLDEAGVENVCGVLEALESYFSRRFAEKASPFQISLLSEIEDAHEAAIGRGDVAQILIQNVRFHDYVNAAASNPVAVEISARQRALLGTLRLDHGFGTLRLKALSKEHRSLIDAFARHDADAAGKIAALHARSSKDDLIDRMRNQARRSAPAA